MKTLYLDIFSGLSGDMFLGAMIDLGVDFAQLQRCLAELNLGGYHLHTERRARSNIVGVQFTVHLDSDDCRDTSGEHRHSPKTSTQIRHHQHSNRSFTQIKELVEGSGLSDWVKQKTIAIFERIAVAEGKIHGIPPEQVTFHEVGAMDSIIDITGACIALELLGRPRVLAAPVVEGMGWVKCAHGQLPVPTPATMEILAARGVCVTQCEEPHELVTPTGAALLAEFAESFGPMQNLVVEKIGYGLGTRENQVRPNVLRAVLGRIFCSECSTSSLDWETDAIAVIETNLDDTSAEILGSFMDKALAAGALDVFHTAIQMKKDRPGVLLTVLCAEAEADRFAEMILRETGAFGVRHYTVQRRKLQRQFTKVNTPYGEVQVKLGKLDGKVLHVAPEYESCKKLAAEKNVPLKQIYQAAIRSFNV